MWRKLCTWEGTSVRTVDTTQLTPSLAAVDRTSRFESSSRATSWCMPEVRARRWIAIDVIAVPSQGDQLGGRHPGPRRPLRPFRAGRRSDTSLGRLNAVTRSGRKDDDRPVRDRRDLDLRLPGPTVSARTTSYPTAEWSAITGRSVAESPPRWPRLDTDRTNTPGSSASSCVRMRSPSSAPPVSGDDGSKQSTATRFPSRRWSATRQEKNVDLPTPGGPVCDDRAGVIRGPRSAEVGLGEAVILRVGHHPGRRLHVTAPCGFQRLVRGLPVTPPPRADAGWRVPIR